MSIPTEPIRTIEYHAELLGVGDSFHGVLVMPTNGRRMIGVFNDAAALARHVIGYDRLAQCYITLNPMLPQFSGRALNVLVPAVSRTNLPPDADLMMAPVSAANREVKSMVRFLLGIDPEKADGFADYCSTDEEYAATLALRDLITGAIDEATGAQSILGSSGNGGTGIYNLEVALAIADAGRCKAALKTLAVKFDNDKAKVDRGVHSPAQLTRLFGTVNVKMATADRPQRRAAFEVETGDASWPLSIEKLESWLSTSTFAVPGNGARTSLSVAEMQKLRDAWIAATANKQRNDLCLGVAGAGRKSGMTELDVIAVVRTICTEVNDQEVKGRIDTVKATFGKADVSRLAGWSYLEQCGLTKADLPSLAGKGQGEESGATAIIKAASDVDLFHDEYGNAMANVAWGEGHQLMKVQGKQFGKWLTHRIYKQRGTPPASQALSSAISILDIQAQQSREVALSPRISDGAGDSIWIDLCDSQGRAIHITSGKVTVVEDPAPRFRRFSHQKSLPMPKPGGSIWQLLEFVNITDWADKILFVVSTVVALVPNIPQVLLLLYGAQGSAKTTAARFRRSLIDPSVTPTVLVKNDIGEYVQALAHHHQPIFDNVTELKGWVAEVLCQAATGGAFAKRAHYSDDGDILYRFTRPITATCLNIPQVQADLLDRAISIKMDRVSPESRREDGELRKQFEAARPYIFGAMLDSLAEAMQDYPTITATGLPRMADFCKWGMAVCQATGVSPENFRKALTENANSQAEGIVESHPLATAILNFVKTQPEWGGTATQLLDVLKKRQGNTDSREPGWLKSPAELGKQLTALQAPLADVGVIITNHRDANPGRQRFLHIQYGLKS